MKNQKARWCHPGAEHIVDLRVLHLNQKWQAFFLMLSALRVILNLRHVTFRKNCCAGNGCPRLNL